MRSAVSVGERVAEEMRRKELVTFSPSFCGIQLLFVGLARSTDRREKNDSNENPNSNAEFFFY